MTLKKVLTPKPNVENEKEITSSDVLAITIFSAICVSSFLFSIFFFIVSIATKNPNYLISVGAYLLVAIISFPYLFKFSNKDKNEKTTNSTGITFPWL